MPIPWIVAGISAGAGLLSAGGANEADKQADAIAEFQDQINVERMKSDVALQSLNMTRDLGALESEQVAMASAMNKRAQGGSFDNIQRVGREDLDDNIERMDSEVDRAEKFQKVSAKARRSATKSRGNARTMSAVTGGLLSFSKALG